MRQEDAVSRLKSQRDKARLKAVVWQGKAESYRRAQGFESEESDCDSPRCMNSDRSISDAELEDESNQEEELVGESGEEEHSDHGDATEEQGINVVYPKDQENHFGMTFFTIADANAMRYGTKRHYVELRESAREHF